MVRGVNTANDVSSGNYDYVGQVINAPSSQLIGGEGGRDLTDLNVFEGLQNKSSGNYDYARQLQMLGFENAYNAIEAQKARDWQERMSNTAYQRAVKDMQSAGLNPYLAYNQGGAYTGSSVSAYSGSGSVNRIQGSNFLQGILSTAVMLALGMNNTATQMAIASGKNNTALEVARINHPPANRFEVRGFRP